MVLRWKEAKLAERAEVDETIQKESDPCFANLAVKVVQIIY